MIAHGGLRSDLSVSPARDELPSICAIHNRIGGNKGNLGTDVARFFSPQLSLGDESIGCCRSWSIVARVASFQGGDDNSVHLFALPLRWKPDEPLDDDVDDDEEHCRVPFYLSCRLVLPSPYRVKEIAFYGDDGNSSLSVGTDVGGTGQEGRQAMGLLVSCPATEENAALTAEELWLVQYDQAVYHRVSVPSGAGGESLVDLDERALMGDSVVNIQPLRERQDDAGDEEGEILAKSTWRLSCSHCILKSELNYIPFFVVARRVALKTSDSSSQMLLSGSRGVGGVLVTAPSHVELDLFDLEEDEDGSEDGSDEEEDE